MRTIQLPIDMDRLAGICSKHAISELSLFGSVLSQDFRPDSDVDVLIQFQEGRTLTLDSYVEISYDLARLFGSHEIDLVEMNRLSDPYRRHEILRTRETIYVACSATLLSIP